MMKYFWRFVIISILAYLYFSTIKDPQKPNTTSVKDETIRKSCDYGNGNWIETEVLYVAGNVQE